MGYYTANGQMTDPRSALGAFYTALAAERAADWTPDLVMRLPSDQETENHDWLGSVPTMREWIGGRQEKTVKRFRLAIRNKKHELTLPLDVDDQRRDKSGQLATLFTAAAQEAVWYPQSLLSTIISTADAGTNGLAYDGQFFFDTDHNESGTSQSNDLTSTEIPAANVVDPANPTVTEAANILVQVAARFRTFTNDQGRAINQGRLSLLIMTGNPLIAAAFQGAINAINLPGSVTNPVQGTTDTYSVIQSPAFSTTETAVRFFVTSKAIKPLILQEEVPLQQQLLGPGSEEEFKNDRHLFGLKWVGGVGYGFWQGAILLNLS